MTIDKQIIIDIKDSINKVKNIEKMYFSLLDKYKRKEQECERLKHDNGYEVGALEKTIDNLKAENEELKTKVFRFESRQTSMGKQNKELIEDNLNLSKENAKIKAENDELKNKTFRYEELLKHSAMSQNTYTAEEVNIITGGIKFVGRGLIIEENIKLHKTLSEIKEIAITGLEGFCPKCSRKECEDNNCIETAIRDILQKISECEGNDGQHT